MTEGVHIEPDFGMRSNNKIQVSREFTNSVVNNLGLPLPKGRLRVYRHNTDGQMEFIGENVIDHTPRDEVVRLPTGNAFDLVGERKQTNFKSNLSRNVGAIDPATGLPVPAASAGTNAVPWIDESFEIDVRNHKREPVEVRVVEHLYRYFNWEITAKSHDFRKTDVQTIEFPVRIDSDAEAKVSYTVHYTW